MEPEGSLTHSQASATCHFPEPEQSSPCLHIQSLENFPIFSTASVVPILALYYAFNIQPSLATFKGAGNVFIRFADTQHT
jgi:hypothetical protein